MDGGGLDVTGLLCRNVPLVLLMVSNMWPISTAASMANTCQYCRIIRSNHLLTLQWFWSQRSLKIEERRGRRARIRWCMILVNIKRWLIMKYRKK